MAVDPRPQHAGFLERRERTQPRGAKLQRRDPDERTGQRVAHGADRVLAGEAEEL